MSGFYDAINSEEEVYAQVGRRAGARGASAGLIDQHVEKLRGAAEVANNRHTERVNPSLHSRVMRQHLGKLQQTECTMMRISAVHRKSFIRPICFSRPRP